jgi:acetyl-CoA carboxylase carboxyltransferase component
LKLLQRKGSAARERVDYLMDEGSLEEIGIVDCSNGKRVNITVIVSLH